MKKIKTTYWGLSLLVAILFTACKKDIGKPDGVGNPPPADTSTLSRSFKLVLDSLPGEALPSAGLSALISVTNEFNVPVIINQKIALSYAGKYSSEKLSLNKGNYKINKLLVTKGNEVVRFATPHAGSVKAPLVTKPLALSFTLSDTVLKEIPAQVLRIVPGDRPEDFGYPAGEFNNPLPGDSNTTFDIKIQPLIKIGNVIYDSIPVTLKLTTWENSGHTKTTTLSFSPGTNKVTLLKAATKYQFEISKWGTYDQLTLLRNQVEEGTLYSLGGSREAKKLKSDLTYRLLNGIWLPETKRSFEYGTNGSLKQVTHYGRRPDQTPYIVMTDKFEYKNSQVEKIVRYNENAVPIETKTFSYNTQGKPTRIIQEENNKQTIAEATYTSLPGRTGISANYRIDVRYQSNNSSPDVFYNMQVQGGNVMQDSKSSSNGNHTSSHYQYDFAINPYAHLQWPDLYFSHYSKQNRTAQHRTYVNEYPQTEAYDISFRYDGDGYPIEQITKYRTWLTQRHAYTIKTVYTY
jgi:hypothetical protein